MDGSNKSDGWIKWTIDMDGLDGQIKWTNQIASF